MTTYIFNFMHSILPHSHVHSWHVLSISLVNRKSEHKLDTQMFLSAFPHGAWDRLVWQNPSGTVHIWKDAGHHVYSSDPWTYQSDYTEFNTHIVFIIVNHSKCRRVWINSCKVWRVYYRPYPKDGEGNVFTCVCLFTGRVPHGLWSHILFGVLPRAGEREGRGYPLPPWPRQEVPSAPPLPSRTRERVLLCRVQ